MALPPLAGAGTCAGMPAIAIMEDQGTIRDAYSPYLQAQPEFRLGIVAASAEALAQVKEALLQVAAGGSPMSPSIARHVVAHFQPRPTAEEVLTARGLQLVQAIEDGLRYKQIAGRLGPSTETGNSHIRNIYRKLEVRSKVELVGRRPR